MGRTIKNYCNVCHSPAIVIKSERQHDDYLKIYFVCKNKQCNHRWVADQTFSHTTHESHLLKNGILKAVLNRLPLAELKEIKNFVLEAEEKQMALL